MLLTQKQSVGRHVAPLRHIILIPSQLVSLMGSTARSTALDLQLHYTIDKVCHVFSNWHSNLGEED